MSPALNKPKLGNLADEIWKSTERLHGKFKAYEYQNVILPIIVIRRLEWVLIKIAPIHRGAINAERFQGLVRRHGLLDRWRTFERRFLQEAS